jgi:Zn-dependent peptidase ImmA (M78 family)/transcriptional regulator with XRE-family HTH domain
VPATEDWEGLRRSFDGDQLRIARELRRMTQAALARAAVDAGHAQGLTAAAVSQFELGAAVPSAVTMQALVAALEIDAAFLSFTAADDEAHLPAFFRSLRATPAQDRKYARNVIQLVHRLAVALDQHVGLPPRDVPTIPCDPFDEADARRAAAEDAAGAVRKAWRMDRGPVADVVGTIESHGVVCTRLRFRDERVDAFSVNFSDHPVAVLATDKDKWDRSRFDAAHELGHLVMHDEAAGVPEAERQANEFAAAFLMPARDLQGVLPAHADWRRLMELKSKWGVSIAALLMRARRLGVMTETTYVSATKMMSARGWRRHEPVDGTPEVPALLQDALTRAHRRGLAAEDLRREAAIPADIFEEVCQLISGQG